MIGLTGKGIDFELKAGEVLVRKAGLRGWKNNGSQWAKWAQVVVSGG